jgi:hypothetical protein
MNPTLLTNALSLASEELANRILEMYKRDTPNVRRLDILADYTEILIEVLKRPHTIQEEGEALNNLGAVIVGWLEYAKQVAENETPGN